MTLQWISVVVFLYGELALGFLLSVGLLSNARWKNLLTSRIVTLVTSHGTFLFYSFIILLMVLFTDSASTTYRMSKSDPTAPDLRNNPQAEVQLHMKLFRAQRNLYITGESRSLALRKTQAFPLQGLSEMYYQDPKKFGTAISTFLGFAEFFKPPLVSPSTISS